MTIYTKPREHDFLIGWLLSLIKGKETPDLRIEQAICNAVEGRGDFMYIEFTANRKVQGSIIGVGKEPDVPAYKQALLNKELGELHRDKLRLGATSIFICQEHWEGDLLYLKVSCAKIYQDIIAPPKIETFQLRVERDGGQRLVKIHDEKPVPASADQQYFINAYLGL